MTIDTYLKKSRQCIEYAETLIATDPQRAQELLVFELREKIRLLNRITDQQSKVVS